MNAAAETATRPTPAALSRAAFGEVSQRGLRRRARKKLGIVFSFAGIAFGLMVTLAFHLAGFWQVSLRAWAWLAVANALYHGALWLVPHLGWDERLRWDPQYLYLPWACVVIFFTSSVYLLPDARPLIPYGFLVNLLLLVGVAGFRDVLGFSFAMWAGYFGAVVLLVKQGAPLSLPFEGARAGLFLGVSLLAGVVLNRARRHRRELAGMRQRLSVALRGSGAGWWDLAIDPAQPTVIPDEAHLSPELKALIGFENHEFPNSLSAWHSRIHAEDVDEIRASAERHLSGDAELRETRYRIHDKNGGLRQIYSHSRIQRNSEGVPIRWSGLEWDITERERDQQSLRKLSSAVEQSPSIVIITDTEGRIEYVNPKFCHTTGYSLAEVLGETPGILRSADTPPEDYDAMWREIRDGGEWKGEFKSRRKDGEFYRVLSSITPIKSSAGETMHFLAVQEDVTERRRVEAQLNQANRMESVGRLVSGVAHDFNNLLTAVLGFAELGLASVDEEHPASEHLAQIRGAGESAGELTRQLLAFGRQQILRFEILDINEKARSVEKLLRRTIGEDLELVIQLAPDLRNVKVDPTSIEQVLVNLAVNARDAMPDGGRLTIETANVEVRESHPADELSPPPGSYVVLSVMDTGRGMDDETRSRAFEPFFTTKERGRGTGLGLSTVYGIVKQSDGHISVTSEVDGGTRFDVYLPQTREQVRPASKIGEVGDAKAGPETILLVEDDERVRSLVRRVLDARGYQVLSAADGAEALEIWHREHCDLLLSDIVMPGISGVELAETLRRQRPGLKVILMSGYADQEVAGEQINTLDTPFIGKPFRPNDLLQKVRAVLGGDETSAERTPHRPADIALERC